MIVGISERENNGAESTHWAPPMRSAPTSAIRSWRRGGLFRRLRLDFGCSEPDFFLVTGACRAGGSTDGTNADAGGSVSAGRCSFSEESGLTGGPFTSAAWLSSIEMASL